MDRGLRPPFLFSALFIYVMTIEWNLSQLSILVGYIGFISYIYLRLLLSSVCIPLHLRDNHKRLLLIERPFFYALLSSMITPMRRRLSVPTLDWIRYILLVINYAEVLLSLFLQYGGEKINVCLLKNNC